MDNNRLYVTLIERNVQVCQTCASVRYWSCGCSSTPSQHLKNVLRWEFYSANKTSGISCFDRPGPAVNAMNRHRKMGLNSVVKYIDIELLQPWTNDEDERYQAAEAASLKLAEKAQELSRGGEIAPLFTVKRPKRKQGGR